MIDLAKILVKVFSYFYKDHLIIPFIDKYQFVRSNSCRPNGTTILMIQFWPFLIKIIHFLPFKWLIDDEFSILFRLNLNQVLC